MCSIVVAHQVFHERSNHVDVRMHFVRDVVQGETIKVEKIDTKNNPSDMLAKAVPRTKFIHCISLFKCCLIH